jgi:hypothetical protein
VTRTPYRGSVSLSLLGLAFALAASVEAERDAILELVVTHTGRPVTVCARFNRYDTFRQNQPSDRELRRVETCLSEAYRARRRFFFSIEGGGADSYVGSGLMGDAAGNVKRFWYDSAPCGGPGCGESFRVATCPVPKDASRIDPRLDCPRE